MAKLNTEPAGVAALRFIAAALFLAGTIGGCSYDHNSPPAPDALTIVAGDGQVALPGATLPESTVIRLVDIAGNPVAAYPIEWHLTVMGGEIEPATPVTDANGRLAARWTLSSTAGPQVIRVVATSSITQQLTAIASPTAPTAFQIEVGDGQTGHVSQPLPTDPAVVVLDINGQPVKGVAVSWSVTGGGGRISQVSSITGTDGVATTTWTLGSTAGPQQLTSSVRGLPALIFSATATS
jgi:Big-like domain-containing protein